MEIKKNNNVICLVQNNEIIETYEFDKVIDFSKLINYLMKQDFNAEIALKDNLEEKTDQESNLVNFIEKIISNYNVKVNDFLNEVKKDNRSSDEDY